MKLNGQKAGSVDPRPRLPCLSGIRCGAVWHPHPLNEPGTPLQPPQGQIAATRLRQGNATRGRRHAVEIAHQLAATAPAADPQRQAGAGATSPRTDRSPQPQHAMRSPVPDITNCPVPVCPASQELALRTWAWGAIQIQLWRGSASDRMTLRQRRRWLAGQPDVAALDYSIQA